MFELFLFFLHYNYKSHKIIKKIGKISLILFLTLILLLGSSYGLLQSKRVQTFVTQIILNFLEKNLNNKFSIETINITFFNKASISKFYVEDLNKDTLIYADRINVQSTNILRSVITGKNKLRVKRIELDHAYINLYSDSDDIPNIAFIIEHLKKNKDTTKTKKPIIIKSLSLADSKIKIRKFNGNESKGGIDFSNISMQQVNAVFSNLKPSGDTLAFSIDKLNFIEKSGFIMNDMSSEMMICNSRIMFSNASVNTGYSSFLSDYISLSFENFKAFKNDRLYNDVKLNIKINSSHLHFYDLAYVAPTFANTTQVINFSGILSGRINNLKGDGVNIHFGKSSDLLCNFSFSGLPDVKETFMIFDVNSFTTSPFDIAQFHLPGNKTINLPDNFNYTGRLVYKGNFTGFIDDFVTYGTLSTDIGNISSDILFKPASGNRFSFKGNLKMDNFNIGQVISADKIGKISMNVSVDGSSGSNAAIDAIMQGKIENFEVNNYNYRNIDISGNLTNKTFDGKIGIQDPNINLAFNGNIDFSNKIAKYDFTADVQNANLYSLNFDKTEPTHNVSFYITANAIGNSIETLDGEISLLNSNFSKKDRQIQINDFKLIADNTPGSNKISVRSDFIDADFWGSYRIEKIQESLRKFVNIYFPTIIDSSTFSVTKFENDFELTAKFKNTNPFFEYFLPEFFVAPNTLIESGYTAQDNHFYLFLQSPLIKYNNHSWKNMYINAESSDSILNLISGSKELLLADRISLQNFSIYSKALLDSFDVSVRWNNWDSVAYSGNIATKGFCFKEPGHTTPGFMVNILDSKVVTKDTLWNIANSRIRIDSSGIVVENFNFNHQDQYFMAYGSLSKSADDSLTLTFNQFNLAHLNAFTLPAGFFIQGILDGNATVSNIFNSPLFRTKLHVTDLTVNNELLGNTILNSIWDNQSKSINIEANTTRDTLKVIDVKGDYFPERDKGLAFSITLNKLKLEIIDQYVNKLLGNINGLVTGKLALSGTLSKPILNGNIDLQNTIFTMNYLNTRYSFSDKFDVINNNFFINNLQVYDSDGNTALANGIIRTEYLRNVNFDMTLNARDFLFLDTRAINNPQYYGTAYATGQVKLKGTPKDVTIDVKARTERNTRFFIPLNQAEIISEYNFITLYGADSTARENTSNSYNVNLSGVQLNFDLEITPDAEVQIIFDPTVGDIIKGRGYGEINMAISTLGKFNMMGEFDIVEGDYLFTLQDVINKKLKVESGSKVTWRGDPLDAILDVNAYYRTKASLYDLFGDNVENYKTRTTIDCKLNMTGNLSKPKITYDIYLPFAEEDTRRQVSNAITSEEELSKQFLALMVLNRFLPNNSLLANNPSYLASGSGSNVAGVNASELLSNQLSNWLSQISNDFDVGINYRPGDKITSNEVEFALSTQLLNDRLSINGNIDVTTNATANSTNNIVGDFDVDYKLNKNGKLRVKAFNRANDDLISEISPYTQGVGLFYKEEFNTLGELLRRYWRSLTGKNNKNKNDDKLSQK
ncbi:MAG: translocation/assembly module TamB [Bacteroidales bacterium]|nr:translocation/assembly module TamB [Bacteroidales bacterium]